MPVKNHPVVAITGANGFLGSSLVKHFTGKGWHVIGLVRSVPQSDNPLVSYRPYNLGEPLHKDTLKGADFVVHTAYVKYDHQHRDAMQINVQGAKHLVDASKKAGVKKSVFISSMSSHEDAISVYGKQKLAIEDIFDKKRDVILRPGLIVGTGGIVKEMATFMKTKRVVPLVGGGMQPLQTIAVYDLVRCIDHALTTKVSGLFTVATSRVYTYKEFYAAIGNQIGVKPLFIPVPFFVLQSALKLAALLHVNLSVSEDNLLGLKKLRSAETKKDLKQLGVDIDDLATSLQKLY